MYTALRVLVLSSTVDQTVCTVLVQLGTGEAPKLDLWHKLTDDHAQIQLEKEQLTQQVDGLNITNKVAAIQKNLDDLKTTLSDKLTGLTQIVRPSTDQPLKETNIRLKEALRIAVKTNEQIVKQHDELSLHYSFMPQLFREMVDEMKQQNDATYLNQRHDPNSLRPIDPVSGQDPIPHNAKQARRDKPTLVVTELPTSQPSSLSITHKHTPIARGDREPRPFPYFTIHQEVVIYTMRTLHWDVLCPYKIKEPKLLSDSACNAPTDDFLLERVDPEQAREGKTKLLYRSALANFNRVHKSTEQYCYQTVTKPRVYTSTYLDVKGEEINPTNFKQVYRALDWSIRSSRNSSVGALHALSDSSFGSLIL